MPLLEQVTIDYESRVKISQICSELDVDGLRGDIVTNRASQSLAAFRRPHRGYPTRYISSYSPLPSTSFTKGSTGVYRLRRQGKRGLQESVCILIP